MKWTDSASSLGGERRQTGRRKEGGQRFHPTDVLELLRPGEKEGELVFLNGSVVALLVNKD